MNAIEIDRIGKEFKGVKALDGVSLTVKKGEIFGLLGENGAGKTTLIRILCGLTRPTAGAARVFGFDCVRERDKINPKIGISTQETAVAPNLTVRENLDFFARIYGMTDEAYMERIVKTFRLDEAGDRKAKTLSGGWLRRLSLATALIPRPELLFLDEPTLGLDVLARRELWEIVRSLKGEMTVLLTSHYLNEIESLCDRSCILDRGRLVASGTAEEIERSTGAESFEEAFIRAIEGVKR